MILWLIACAGGGVDTASPTAPEQPCVRELEVTWANWAGDFFVTQCQGCHASTAPDRYGAPPAVTFDTEADAIALADAIRRTVIEASTMPPAGGLTDDDVYLLGEWVRCY